MLRNKKILLGVTGSIAAYKTATLVRLLVKAGASVKIIMTPAAKDFITPLTLSTLSKNAVLSDFTDANTGSWNNHIELVLWADIMLIAPASANTIAKMAHGICDNLLLAAYLSAKCPVYYAPAMDLDMYQHHSAYKNREQLKIFGNIIIPPATGELARGLYGEGRMAEPEEVINHITNNISKTLALSGKKILLTAGPTYESIDPVRFIGNHSSGKMGFALAEELAEQGAIVILVTGPTVLETINSTIRRIDVTNAAEMYEACVSIFKEVDIAVMTAAVADYTPKKVFQQKVKKQSKEPITIELIPTKDILGSLGQIKKTKQLLIGFALETENEIENAQLKLKAKKLDLIVLNSLNDAGAGFRTDTNKITIIDSENNITAIPLQSKAAIAKHIVAKITTLI